MTNQVFNFFKHKNWIYLLLIVIPLCLYLKSLFFLFSPLDEQWLILDNTNELSDWRNLPALFKKPIVGLYYRPLLNVSLMFDYHIGKLNPFFYHFTNLVLHTISVILFYSFLSILKVPKKQSLLLALLFCVHPIVLHAVAWIPGRNDLLLTVFMLSAMINLVKFLLSYQNKFLFFHIIFFICALFTKENACFLPIIFLLVLYIFPKKKQFPFYLILLWFTALIIWFVLRKNAIKPPQSLEFNSLITLKNFVFGYILFFGKTIIPIHQSVFPTLKNASILPGLIALVLLAIAYLKIGLVNKKIAYLGLVIFFMTSFLPLWFAATSAYGEQYEHRIYPSLIGVLLFVSQLNFNVDSKKYSYLMVFFIVIFSTKTFLRMDVYKNETSFTDIGIIEAPDYYLFHLRKADALLQQQHYNEALVRYNTVLKLQPERVQAYNSRANVYLALKKKDEAINDCNTSINLWPNDAAAYLNRMMIYQSFGDYENASKDFAFLVQNYPHFIPDDLEKKLSIEFENNYFDNLNSQILQSPNNAKLFVARAEYLLSRQLKKEALSDLKRANELEPNNSNYKVYYDKLHSMLYNK